MAYPYYELSATQRQYPFIGSLADLLTASTAPNRTQQARMMAEFFGLPSMATTLDRISYGEPLTTGTNQTLQMKPETAESLINMLGMGVPAGRPTAVLAKETGAALKPLVGEALESAADMTRMYAAPPARQGVSEAPAAITDIFAQKAAREKAISKKVAKTPSSGQSGPVGRSKVGKVDPDIYRSMERRLGSDAAMAAALRGEHLKPDGYGGYIGAPRHVTSPQALGALRSSLSNQFETGVNVLEQADPTRLGTWYDRAKAAQASTNEPWQLPQSLNQHSVYSAGVSPESELGFALKHQVSRDLGLPDMAYRSAPMNTLDTAFAENRMPKLGFKIGEYRNKNDPLQPNTGLFGVNDFRAAQGFGYTTPDGKIWKGGVRSTMHPFMDAETALAVNRANKANVGGRADWQGPHLQEVPWVLGKAQDLYRRGSGKTGRYNAKNFGGDENLAMQQAIRDANNTFEDYLYKHTASATHESIPGASTGHVPQMLSAPPAEKAAYTEAGSWNLMDQLGEPKDALYSSVGLRQLPEVNSVGAYENSAGQFETNPMTIARPLLDFPTGGGGGRVASTRQSLMDAVEQMRAAVDAQEAGAWNLPNTMRGVKGKNSAVIDSRGIKGGTSTTGVQPSADALAKANELLANSGYGVTATSRGVSIFPFDSAATSKDLNSVLKKHGGALKELFPGQLQKGVSSSGYVPGIGKWGSDKIVPTDPFSGEATAGLLQAMADAPPEVAKKISESEGVRKVIKKIIARDASAGNAREDIQEMRKFLSEADWNKAVEMIRAGVKPAAALSALGYSLSSMAAEE
jgi:hypothetical protein